MEFIVDHDYHIHSRLSLCSGDPEQNPERILAYAQKYNLKEICLTDHFWDDKVVPCPPDDFYEIQNYEHIRGSLPLPQAPGVRFAFGCETEFTEDLRLGVSRERMEELDYIIIPTTHMHMHIVISPTADAAMRAKAWETRFEALLSMDLPFHKIGVAHLACSLIMGGSPVSDVLDLISDDVYHRLFAKAANVGVGIELNSDDLSLDDKSESCNAAVIRMFTAAKEEGCKFYLGSDAHHPDELDKAPDVFRAFVAALGLTENDKFHPFN